MQLTRTTHDSDPRPELHQIKPGHNSHIDIQTNLKHSDSLNQRLQLRLYLLFTTSPLGDTDIDCATSLAHWGYWSFSFHEKKQCGGVGGILDSLLDIIGQCMPSREDNSAALPAGCCTADAKKIRSNCCALISLLVATQGAEANGVLDEIDFLEGDSDEPKGMPGSADGFMSTNIIPGPKATTAIAKNRRAARQELLASSAKSKRSSRQPKLRRTKTHQTHPGASGNLPIMPPTKRRIIMRGVCPVKKVLSLASQVESNIPLRMNGSVAESRKPRIGRSRDLSFSPTTNFGQGHETFTSSRDKSCSDIKSRSSYTGKDTNELGSKIPTKIPTSSLDPVAENLASPPKLRRIKKGASTALNTPTNISSPSRGGGIDSSAPLGVSIPDIGKRTRRAKVSVPKNVARYDGPKIAIDESLSSLSLNYE